MTTSKILEGITQCENVLSVLVAFASPTVAKRIRGAIERLEAARESLIREIAKARRG